MLNSPTLIVQHQLRASGQAPLMPVVGDGLHGGYRLERAEWVRHSTVLHFVDGGELADYIARELGPVIPEDRARGIPGEDGVLLIPVADGLFAQIDAEDYPLVRRYEWGLFAGRYASATESVRGERTAHLMHRLILMLPASCRLEVDHINQDKLDNRKSNLRLCTRGQNTQNRGLQANNTSGFKNVFRVPRGWRVAIEANGKKFTKDFADLEDAVICAHEQREALHGEFACHGRAPSMEESHG